jgi:hypothetical protein
MLFAKYISLPYTHDMFFHFYIDFSFEHCNIFIDLFLYFLVVVALWLFT